MANYSKAFLLDLTTLAYQLHAQTLIWPLDPYGEQVKLLFQKQSLNPNVTRESHKRSSKKRDAFLEHAAREFHAWKQNRQPQALHPGFVDIVGPDRLGVRNLPGGARNNFPFNNLDAIFQRYDRINPNESAFTCPNAHHEPFVKYDMPNVFTNEVREVHVVSENQQPALVAGGQQGHNTRQSLNVATHAYQIPHQFNANGSWWLYCFEGRTGMLPQGANMSRGAQSLMGFVGLRDLGQQRFDLFVCFRGSRSGKLRVDDAFDKKERNPDWATDGYMNESKGKRTQALGGLKPYPPISGVYDVHKGIALALEECLPTLNRCFELARTQIGQGQIADIYFVGHSLGACLAATLAMAKTAGDIFNQAGGLAQGSAIDTLLGQNLIRVRTFAQFPITSRRFYHHYKQGNLAQPLHFHDHWVKGEKGHQNETLRRRVGYRFLPETEPIGKPNGTDAHSPQTIRSLLPRHCENDGNPPPEYPPFIPHGPPGQRVWTFDPAHPLQPFDDQSFGGSCSQAMAALMRSTDQDGNQLNLDHIGDYFDEYFQCLFGALCPSGTGAAHFQTFLTYVNSARQNGGWANQLATYRHPGRGDPRTGNHFPNFMQAMRATNLQTWEFHRFENVINQPDEFLDFFFTWLFFRV